MARIETYPLDGNISVNDYVIGTDGDSFNATKNYKVLTFLDYLGRLYNLNSTDLLFNFVDMPSTMISAGEVSTNNYADGTLLMSGVANIYVSKVTAFGQLVDSILTSIGDQGLTIMFADMGNRNNLGIFTVVSAVDVDANTINLTVSGTTAIGSIDAGKVMGIRIGVGGGGGSGVSWGSITGVLSAQTDLQNALNLKASLSGNNTWTGFLNYFSNNVEVLGEIRINEPLEMATFTGNLATNSSDASFAYIGSGKFGMARDGSSTGIAVFDINAVTGGEKTFTLQNSSGTLAFLSDIPSLVNYVTTNTVQNITNYKTFDVGFAVEGSVQLNDSLGGIGAVLMNARGFDLFLGRGSDNVKGVILDMSNFTALTTFTHTVQAQNGTIALTSDIPPQSGVVGFSTTAFPLAGVQSSTEVMTYTLPAGTMINAGDVIRIKTQGYFFQTDQITSGFVMFVKTTSTSGIGVNHQVTEGIYSTSDVFGVEINLIVGSDGIKWQTDRNTSYSTQNWVDAEASYTESNVGKNVVISLEVSTNNAGDSFRLGGYTVEIIRFIG